MKHIAPSRMVLAGRWQVNAVRSSSSSILPPRPISVPLELPHISAHTQPFRSFHSSDRIHFRPTNATHSNTTGSATASEGSSNNSSSSSNTGNGGGSSSGGSGGSSSSSSSSSSGSFFRSDSWVKTVGTIGALANWTIPLAAITHMLSNKDPGTTIDPVMTSSLAVYSLLFMRWSMAVTPANYPLLVCHICNEIAQLTQLARYAMASSDSSTPAQLTAANGDDKDASKK